MTDKLSLSELQLIIRDSLYMALPDMYWVVAEISEIKENYSGHCYLELIEKQQDEKNLRARVKAIIWCKRYGFLRSYFENITGESLREGLKILVRVKIEYHELFGLSLIICDIDPAFTVGEMAMKRQLIIRRLEEEGIFTMNKEISLPYSIQKIAVISSSNAAGYTDFMNHLTGNTYTYVFYTKLFESPMQGSDTEQGIITALDKIAIHAHLFDIVVIIRGGGSVADLSWFDNYNIAYHVTQFPLPVITGIGHEKDMSVTDMVACMALKTPTAVADFIVGHMAEIGNHLTEMMTSIRDLSRLIIEKNLNRIEAPALRLLPLSRIMIANIKDMISEKTIRMISLGKENTRKAGLIPAGHLSRLRSGTRSFAAIKGSYFERAVTTLRTGTVKLIRVKNLYLETLEKTLDILSPEKVLLRGYTITSKNGIIIKKKADTFNDDIISTRFSDGTVSSRVTGNENEE